MIGKWRKCLIYNGWKAFDVYRENLVKYRKISQKRDLKWKESCLYGIICIRITPFLGTWFVVFSQLYYTISGEELF